MSQQPLVKGRTGPSGVPPNLKTQFTVDLVLTMGDIPPSWVSILAPEVHAVPMGRLAWKGNRHRVGGYKAKMPFQVLQAQLFPVLKVLSKKAVNLNGA